MTKYTLDEVNDMYVDVLKEIGNVGSGNGDRNRKYGRHPH